MKVFKGVRCQLTNVFNSGAMVKRPEPTSTPKITFLILYSTPGQCLVCNSPSYRILLKSHSSNFVLNSRMMPWLQIAFTGESSKKLHKPLNVLDSLILLTMLWESRKYFDLLQRFITCFMSDLFTKFYDRCISLDLLRWNESIKTKTFLFMQGNSIKLEGNREKGDKSEL